MILMSILFCKYLRGNDTVDGFIDNLKKNTPPPQKKKTKKKKTTETETTTTNKKSNKTQKHFTS